MRGLLFRIAMEELVENAEDVIEIKMIHGRNNEKLYKLAVRVKDKEGEYIAHAVIRLTPPASNEGYLWKLVDFWWEEKK
jgi:hypothetical protein